MENEKTLIVVPAYNEQRNILRVIADVKVSVPDADILVVNDCSLDDTAEKARMVDGVKVIDLPYNLGIGGAVQTGFKYAADQGYAYMVQIDGDGQHIPREVNTLRQAMEQSGSDMVIGSRFLNIRSFRTTCCRRIGIKFFYYLFWLLIDTRITDGTSGFRLYNQRCIKVLARYYPSDYPEPDAIILLTKHGFKIAEAGVEMRERAHGESSITPIKSPYYMAKVLLSILFPAPGHGGEPVMGASIDKIHLLGMAFSLVMIIAVGLLVRERLLKEKYALVWLIIGSFILVMSAFRNLMEWFSGLIGVDYAPSSLFAILIACAYLLLLNISVNISDLKKHNKALTQELGLTKLRLEELEKKVNRMG